MNYKIIGRYIARILLIESVFMMPAMAMCAYDGEIAALRAFTLSFFITVAISVALYIFSKGANKTFYAREGFVSVGMSWIAMSFTGCMPFYISREIPRYIDALFEIVSGFTTTGASILSEVESMSRGMLYWRSFSHWLGGMGVLVFLLALNPRQSQESGFTMHILRAESPGPNVGKLVPRMRRTAQILYALYIGLTVLNFIFLKIGGMSWFDSVCTALGTAGTGGFGVKNDSIAGYSPYLQNVCTVFMLLFGVNFSCYYMLLLKKVKDVLKDEELRTYIIVVTASILLITANVRSYYGSIGETVRHAAFQVASVVTTTGFATTDFDLWPSFSKGILMCLMVMGACAGSTGGGLKVGRALLLYKNLKREIHKMLDPQKVQVVRNNDVMVSEKVINNTNTYLVAYGLIILGSFLLISLDGFSMMTNFSAVIACFNNIGPGFEAVGPTCNFASFSIFSKIVLIIDMLAGRLEIFPILVLLSKSTWSHK